MIKHIVVVLAGLNLCGCAAMQSYNSPARVRLYPKKAVLVETPMVRDGPALDELFAPGLPKAASATRRAVRHGVENAQSLALATMRRAMGKQTEITVDDSAPVSRAVDELQIDNAGKSITAETAKQLRAASGADALLRFRITDYGVTPKSWRSALITFEVTSTLGIAAIAYSYRATRALAGVYLVQEGVEETAEAYTGFWALDEVCRPVHIEAELFDLTTGARIWADSATGLSDIRLARLVDKIGPAERQAQLNGAARNAVAKIVGNLRKALPPRGGLHGVALGQGRGPDYTGRARGIP